MNTATTTLAQFAATLRFDAIPVDVLNRAKACIADTVACATYGASFTWSEAVVAYGLRYGNGGPCTVFGVDGAHLQAPFAALANGAAAHAFEQDSLRFPGAGVHPGATLVPTIIAACEETGADGRTALLAFVAGCEVMFRIGAASHHSSEKLGFHAPGLTGPYGAAVAVAVVYGLDAARIGHALGIAGSMSAGLLAFTKSADGAMVKRLHMGRACEAGIIAARLAADGFTGPETVLEGRFGYLETYCRDADAALLTANLGLEWETLRICNKRYACHVTAQAPVQAVRELMREHRFTGTDVESITLLCNEKVRTHHDIRAPQDVMQAQYSVPFCVALALFRDPDDPRVFDASALRDPAILGACRLVDLQSITGLPSAWSAQVVIKLRDGRVVERVADKFKGMPADPLSMEEQRMRFSLLTHGLGESRSASLYARLMTLDEQAAFPAP